jgi:uncharacterized protein (DUF302 family)
MTDAFEVELAQPFDEVIQRVTDALKKEGFGVLTRIDLDQAFRDKLGKEFRPYAILGACNPPLAFRAVSARPEVGLYLPCNVTVEGVDDATSRVRLLDPAAIMGQASFAEDAEMIAVAEEARDRIGRVAAALRIGA